MKMSVRRELISLHSDVRENIGCILLDFDPVLKSIQFHSLEGCFGVKCITVNTLERPHITIKCKRYNSLLVPLNAYCVPNFI